MAVDKPAELTSHSSPRSMCEPRGTRHAYLSEVQRPGELGWCSTRVSARPGRCTHAQADVHLGFWAVRKLAGGWASNKVAVHTAPKCFKSWGRILVHREMSAGTHLWDFGTGASGGDAGQGRGIIKIIIGNNRAGGNNILYFFYYLGELLHKITYGRGVVRLLL